MARNKYTLLASAVGVVLCTAAALPMIIGETPIIEATEFNSRRISASIVVQRPPEDVWRILTDYNNLANHVPNLVVSNRLPHPDGPDGIRVYQEGAQQILGFEFSAEVTLDLVEIIGPEPDDTADDLFGREPGDAGGPYVSDEEARQQRRKIKFSLVESRMLATFEGEWVLQPHTRASTKLVYTVNVTPRFLVPVLAIEWRIREDVPANLRAMKAAVESLPAVAPSAVPAGDAVRSTPANLTSSAGPEPHQAAPSSDSKEQATPVATAHAGAPAAESRAATWSELAVCPA